VTASNLNLPKFVKPGVYQWVDESAISEVADLLRTQRLSGFLGQEGSQFDGGPWVQRLESMVCAYHNHKFAVSFNSWTSGLDAIFLAIGVEKGMEVIVPTWTMSATISSIVNAGLKPVFADIDQSTFNLSVDDLTSMITSQTKAICTVDLFGRPADFMKIREFADENGLIFVTDSAQTPGGTINGISPSKAADIGGYSFNRHKHIQTGEGGVVVTDNPLFAQRLKAIRNHGEVAAPLIQINNNPIYGHNWRLGEVEALLACKQYENIEKHLESRRKVGQFLTEKFRQFSELQVEKIPENVVHDYYILGMKVSSEISRDKLADALQNCGLDFVISRYSSLQNLPAFSGFALRVLPNAVELNESSFIGLYLCGYDFKEPELNAIVQIFTAIFESGICKI